MAEDEFTSDDLADSIVDVFNSIEDSPFKFSAFNPPEIIEIEAEDVIGWTVQVCPFAESEDSEDRGDMCREELQVDAFVHGPLTATITRKVAIRFMRKLRRSLRETEFEGFRWQGNETVNGIFDFDAMKTKKQFLSMFRATYFNFG